MGSTEQEIHHGVNFIGSSKKDDFLGRGWEGRVSEHVLLLTFQNICIFKVWGEKPVPRLAVLILLGCSQT